MANNKRPNFICGDLIYFLNIRHNGNRKKIEFTKEVPPAFVTSRVPMVIFASEIDSNISGFVKTI